MINFEIQRYYQNEAKFNSRDNLPNELNDWTNVISVDKYAEVSTDWIALYVLDNDVTYFESFGFEHVSKEIRRFTGNKNMQTNIFRIYAFYSLMCGYFCVEFIDYMFSGKNLMDYNNLLSLNDFKKNDKVILRYNKMDETSSIYPSLNNQTLLRLKKLTKLKLIL